MLGLEITIGAIGRLNVVNLSHPDYYRRLRNHTGSADPKL